MNSDETRSYAVADVDGEGKLPRDYRSIQWWGVPFGTHTNIPDQGCLLTLERAVRQAIGVHLTYAAAAREYGDTLLSSPLRPKGVVHVTPDGFRELAWAWWDDHLGEGHPIIRLQVHEGERPWRYGNHYVLPTDHPRVVDSAVHRVMECLS